MAKPRPSGCKGRRTCLICEAAYELNQDNYSLNSNSPNFVYCPLCNLCYPGSGIHSYKTHPVHEGQPYKFEGIYVNIEFLSEKEHESLIKGIDLIPWDLSQSGRRKQNFGPKCNFKKRKLRLGDFKGFPKFSKLVQDKFKTVPILKDFQTIEQCSLEYDPKQGASIDPHVDDCWIWGERVVTVNLLSDSVLTMTYNPRPEKYNLGLVGSYRKVLDSDGNYIPNNNDLSMGIDEKNDSSVRKNSVYVVEPIKEGATYPIIYVPMPKNSLLVMYGNARYNYEHRILRKDITERRVCLAYREFTPPYLEGGEFYEEGKIVTEKAKEFW